MVMVCSLTLYAWFTPTDFTTCGAILFVFCALTFTLGIFVMFTKNDTAHLIYTCMGILLGSIYIIYDT